MAPTKPKKVTLTLKKHPRAKRTTRQEKAKGKTLEFGNEDARPEGCDDMDADSTSSNRHTETADSTGFSPEVAAIRGRRQA
jgi:hypothetical protein